MPDTIVDTARNENPPVPFVKIQGIKKSFGNVVALSGVDLAVYPGQITAIVGDNGSGKSTLINILSGNLKPDAGTIYIEDKSFTYLTPKQSMDAGISTVYQDLSLDDYRNVAANIFLGNELTRFGLLSRGEMRREASRLIQTLDIELPDINLPVKFFSGGQRQAVAVARAVYGGKKLMIFDEPTAAMGVRESQAVLRLIKQMAMRNFAVIIVCHNLHQVFTIANTICIMRHGRILKIVGTENISLDEVQQLIIDADNVD